MVTYFIKIILLFLPSSDLLNLMEATFDDDTDPIPWLFFLLQISFEVYPLIKIKERHRLWFSGAFGYSCCQGKLWWTGRLWDINAGDTCGRGGGQMHSLSHEQGSGLPRDLLYLQAEPR